MPEFDSTDNEIRYRIADPNAFQPDSFRTVSMTKGVTAIMGKRKGKDTMDVQAMRFDKALFTVAQARAWMKEHMKEAMKEARERPDTAIELTETSPPGSLFGTIQVDRVAGLIRDVALSGFLSANGRVYAPQARTDMVKLYEGASLYLDHPRASDLADRKGSRSVADLIGKATNIRETAERVRGDLVILKGHPLAEMVYDLAERMPDRAGMSHRVLAKTSRRADGMEVVEGVQKVLGLELVTDPATTQGLFESRIPEEESMKEITLAQLREGRPDLVAAILDEANTEAQVTTLKTTITTLEETIKQRTKEVDEFKAREALAAHKAVVAQKLAEAKLPAALVTLFFITQLEEAKDAAAVDALLADRKALIGTTTVGRLIQPEKMLPAALVEGKVPVTEEIVGQVLARV